MANLMEGTGCDGQSLLDRRIIGGKLSKSAKNELDQIGFWESECMSGRCVGYGFAVSRCGLDGADA